MTAERTIPVNLGERSYVVRVGAGLLRGLTPETLGARGVRTVAVISEDHVSKLYAAPVLEALRAAGVSARLLTFPAGEQHKTLATYAKLMDELLGGGPPIDRRTLVVALGGGVTGDLAGFVAATALRGLRWAQCPTTLLADVDASVGGKTAVDHPAGKNLIGAFHQPAGVLIDVETLCTLPARELRSGLAECVKHAVIRDADLLDFLERRADALLTCAPGEMIELVARNVAIKAAVVADDETETGQRAHLNFGHTVGHAVETFVGYGRITHGEAVALGMTAANHIAVSRGMLDAAAAGRVRAALERLGLPTRHDALDADEIWRIMQHDKKNVGGKVRMILARALGRVDIFDDIAPDEVRQAVASLR